LRAAHRIEFSFGGFEKRWHVPGDPPQWGGHQLKDPSPEFELVNGRLYTRGGVSPELGHGSEWRTNHDGRNDIIQPLDGGKRGGFRTSRRSFTRTFDLGTWYIVVPTSTRRADNALVTRGAPTTGVFWRRSGRRKWKKHVTGELGTGAHAMTMAT